MEKKPHRRAQFTSPIKATIYIGSGEAGERLKQMILEDCDKADMDVSPLFMFAYEIFHGLDPKIGEEAERLSLAPADLINQAFAVYLKHRKKDAA